ncbi:MAG: LytTR family transcriptional regulator [Ruminococcus sp.]|nr:LytTR family transcriptional regulator [Ruminococcus sp.]
MQIEIKIDENCSEPKIIIVTDKLTEEVNRIMDLLSEKSPEMIAGFRNDIVEIITPADIIRIFTSNGKTIATTNNEELTLKHRLYELEERLSKNSFVRISNSEIINLKKVRNFDLSFAGTICVKLSDGTITYVSRRYVAKIKQVLGI